MSDIYKEAVLEARKLKELAEHEAKQKIIEAIGPYIKQTINEQISGVSEEFFFEEENEETQVQDPAGLQNQEVGPMGDQSAAAPLNPEDNLGGASMPGADGKLTVDFNDLFAPTDTGMSAAPVAPTPAEPTAPIADPAQQGQQQTPPEEQQTAPMYEQFEIDLLKISEKIDRAFFSESIADVYKDFLKEKLFSLLETLDTLKENGVIDAKQVKINENKLEFLGRKLKEAGISNSYNKKGDQEENNIMTTLKEYTARLFAEEVDQETNKPSTADSKHAAEQSGVSPELGGPEDVKVAAESVEKPAEMPLDQAEPPLDEKDQDKVVSEALAALEEEVEAEGHAGFGPNDTDETPPVEFEVDEKELAEAIEAIRKEGAVSLQEETKEEGWEEGEPEGGADPSQKKLDGTNKPEQEELETLKEEEEVPMDAMDDVLPPEPEAEEVEGAEGDLVLHIELPDEVEDALAAVDASEVSVDVELGDVDLAGAEEASVDDVLPPVEEPVEELPPVEDETEEDMTMEKMAMYEAKIKKASKVLKEYKAQVDSLKADLQEANLFLAKNVYFTKFLQRGDISRGNLEKIAEHLDKAKTVKEAKQIYGRIKVKLNESVKASKKLAGSSSQVTKPGSAVALQESKQKDSDSDALAKRFKQLAGIKD